MEATITVDMLWILTLQFATDVFIGIVQYWKDHSAGEEVVISGSSRYRDMVDMVVAEC